LFIRLSFINLFASSKILFVLISVPFYGGHSLPLFCMTLQLMVVKSVVRLLYLKYAETSTITSVVLFPAIEADLSRRDILLFMLLIYTVYIFICDYDRRAEFFLLRDLFTHLKTNTNTILTLFGGTR